ncbi:MAG: hypothetical protein QMD85_01435 [Candidatus Aenigmarchaeota archaeon]|nr:hypothetical protein [Candidatus Aenigmarchaeota archaeon]
MAYYYTRHDSMGQATATFAPIETAADGSTAGPISIPPGARMIKSITALAVTNGAMTTVTGPIYVLRLSGTGALPDGVQELVISSEHLEDGAGTLTYTEAQILRPITIPVNIAVNPGADLSLLGAYIGTSPGTPFITVEIEFV